MSKAVEKIEPRAVPVAPSMALTPMDMLDRAVASGAPIETLERLIALKERWDAHEARKAFDEAVAGAKAKIKPVARTTKGHNSKYYADFASIARAVDPVLSEFGLSYRFRSEQGDRINVTCILSHKLGHSEETTLSGPPDTTGNKNAIQAIGSTLTYLQRYSLVQALGLAASNDDDAAKATGELVNDDQIGEMTALIQDIGGKKADHLKGRLLKYMKVEALGDIPAQDFKNAMTAIEGQRKNYA